MPTDQRAALREIRTFPSLIKYLRDQMGWPIETESFEDLTFDYTPEELGIEAKSAAKIQEIKRLRPLSANQPWGIFFVKFEPKRLPVVALRRILSEVVLKRRASANRADRAVWAADDLLFVSNYGESGDGRQITFAHFSQAEAKRDLPTLKVLGWDNLDTPLHLDKVAAELTTHLAWPEHEDDAEAWRRQWSAAFSLGHREVITTSRQLSIRLAELARAIRDRIKTALAIETERGSLTRLMKAFQESLVHDLNAEGFADMYAQTIAYGLLSARIANPKANTADHLPAQIPVTNPFLKELMETFLLVGGRRHKAGGSGIDFDELGVSEVVELLGAPSTHIEAVVRDFGDKNPQEDPVIHFYEGFANEYDPIDKVRRGEFYTPRPVVSYIVRSVDKLLRSEFGLPDGLADTVTWGEMAKRNMNLTIPEGVAPDQEFVQILDPATGTGTFLVEVIELIYRTMTAKWEREAEGPLVANFEARWNEYVPKHLLPRLYAYELKMAPYAIAHLKVGLKLYETGYRFGTPERARIFLTNSLEPPSDIGQQALEGFLPALAHEAQAVNAVKRTQRFTVILGNPPYAGISSNMSASAQRLVDAYKTVDGAVLSERKLWLQDDYVKFIRHAQTTIESAGVGVLGYITNHGYLDNPTFRGMRQSLMGTFRHLRLLDLHGNATKNERSPDGSEDKNVFDIKQGVAVCLATRGGVHGGVHLAELWGVREAKYAWLSEHDVCDSGFATLAPDSPYYFFRPHNIDYRVEYGRGWKINEAMPLNSDGFITARDHFVIDFDNETLLGRIAAFANFRLPEASIRATYFPGRGSDRYPDGDTRGWKVPEARRRVAADKKWRERSRACSYRPFDERRVYWTDWMVDWPRPEVMAHLIAGPNVALDVCRQSVSDEWGHVFVARGLVDDCYVSNKTRERGYVHPLYLYRDATGLGFSHGAEPNFAPEFLRGLAAALGLVPTGQHGLPRGVEPEDILNYLYAVLYGPGYRNRYAGLLKIDFPRVPLPGGLELFRGLADLGGELVSLHLLESAKLSNLITMYSGPRNPEVGRIGWSEDTVWLDAAATKKGRPAAPGTIGFRGVPEEVWNFHIGGYQVCEKWLKDRKGRTLSDEDIVHYQKIVVALNETIRIMKEIDEVIEAHGGWPAAFQTAGEKSVPLRLTPPPVQGQLFDQGPGEAVPFRPRIVEPLPEDRYVTCVPLVPLKAAAGSFGDPQNMGDGDFKWVAVGTKHRLRPGMFVAQVVGRSMEPAIRDGAYCLFAAPVEGTRQGKTVLVQLRDQLDPETGDRYTVKRYESEKTHEGDSWRHEVITLKPVNPAFEPIVLTGDDEGQLQVIAEFLEVLTPPVPASPAARTAEPAPAPREIAHSKPGDSRSAAEKPAAEDDEEDPRERVDAAQLDRDELICRVRQLFGDGSPRDREQAIADLARGLGYEGVGSKVREIVDNSLRTAVRRGVLASDGGGLTLDARRIEDYRRDFLKEQFLASLEGRAWKQRDDAIRDLARWLGFRRTGRVIDQTLRSIINGLIREGRLESDGVLIRKSG